MMDLSKIFPVKISLSEQILLSKHLSMMLKSGISEIESLRILRDQTARPAFRKILDKIIGNVENGQFLSESLEKYKGTFGDLFVNIVKLGELSGTLPQNLDYLSGEVKKKTELRSKVKAAMIYPAIILVSTIAVIVLLMVFVLPKILPIFASLKVELPWSTRFLISVSNFMVNDYVYLILGLFGFIGAVSALLRVPSVKYLWHRFMIMMPVVGGISIDYNVANISRVLGLLLKSGVKIVEAVAATSDSLNNLVYKKALNKSVDSIKRGEALYQYLEENPRLFPLILGRMIQIGERTGNLDSNLDYLSQYYENELREKISGLSTVLEPIIMLFMGVLVGFIAVSIITPIYSISSSL